VILGDSERQVAEKFGEAAKTYMNNPVALHLRAMNMLYEGLKANSTIVIVPSTAVESMQLGGLAGLTALTMGLGQEQTRTKNDKEPVISNIPTAAQESDLIPVSRADTMAGPASARENGSLITTPR